MSPEIIAVDQDSAGHSGTRTAHDGLKLVWARSLADGSYAAVLFNRDTSPQMVTVRWKDLPLDSTASVAVRDLWSHKDLELLGNGYSASVPAHGAAMIELTRSAARRQVPVK